MSLPSTVRRHTRRSFDADAPAPDNPRPTLRYGAAFWTIAAVFVTAMAFTTVPTPLYPLYQARDGFSAFTVTIVFAVYAVGVLASLLLAGHVSDWVGRKKVMTAALTLELTAAALFLVTSALPVLIIARLATGLGVGMLTATATAYLQELHSAHRPGASGRRFEVVAAAANIGGLGLGPLVAGALAQYLGAPLRLPYAVFAVLLLTGLAAIALTPETVAWPESRPRYHPQRVRVPDRARPAFFAALITFAVFGLFTALTPLVLRDLHAASLIVTGISVFLVFGAAALAQIVFARLDTRTQLRVGLVLLAVGLVVLTTSVWTASLPVFLVAGAVSGAAAGTAFKGSVSTVLPLAGPQQRGEILAGLFLAAYLGLSVPVLGLGLAMQTMPARDAVLVFAGLFTGLAALLARRFARN